MTLEYFALNSLALVLFFPGIISLHVYLKSKNQTLSFVDLILSGSVLWNFLFTIFSLLLGLFTPFIQSFFSIFMVLSLSVILLCLVFLRRDIVGGMVSLKQVLLNFSRYQGFSALYLLLLWGFIVLLTLFTSIIQNVDAVIYYLPMAKAILQTGGMSYNPLYLSEVAMTYPPALPLMYAFILQVTGDVFLRFLPIVYFLLTNIVIFQLASHLSNRIVGIIAMVAYSSMLATQMLVVLEGLSLDLGYVFYSTFAVYALLKAEDQGRLWYIIAGMACGLAAVTKETGLLTLLLVFAFLLFHSRSRLRRSLFVITATLFFTALQVFEMMTSGPPSLTLLSTPFLHRVFLLAVLVAILWYLSKPYSFHGHQAVTRSQLLSFLVVALIPCLFYLRNIMSLGVLTPGLAPRLASAMAEAEVPQVWAVPQPPDLTSPLALPFIFHLDWHLILLTAPVGLIFLIPGVAGLLVVVRRFLRRNERTVRIFLVWGVSLLVMWSFLSSLFGWHTYGFSFWPSFQYRRLYYFAPVLSLLIGWGFTTLSARVGFSKYVCPHFLSFTTLALACVWLFRQSLEAFILRWIFEATLLDLILFASIFVLILFVPVLIQKQKIFWRPRSISRGLQKPVALLPLIVVLANLCLPIYLLGIGVAWINDESWDPAFYNQVESTPPGLEREPWLEIINYYRDNARKEYVTVMFNSYVFTYFTDSPTIDTYRSFSYEPLLPLLKIEDEATLIQRLKSLQVRYFLFPTPAVPDLYSTFETFANKYLLFRIVLQNPAFTKVKEFTFYRLYLLI